MKRLIALLLAIALCAGLYSFTVSAKTADTIPAQTIKASVSGTWGELNWNIDVEGTLTVTGGGDM